MKKVRLKSRAFKSDNRLKKRDFLRVANKTAKECMRFFGYTKYPYYCETKHKDTAIMAFEVLGSIEKCFVTVDYARFSRNIRGYSKRGGEIYAAFIIAHEMRHYFQFRQGIADKPKVKRVTVDEWEQDKILKDKYVKSTYYTNVNEIDAFAFAYYYVAEVYGCIPTDIGVPPHYRKTMAKYIRKNFGIKHGVFKKKYDRFFT